MARGDSRAERTHLEVKRYRPYKGSTATRPVTLCPTWERSDMVYAVPEAMFRKQQARASRYEDLCRRCVVLLAKRDAALRAKASRWYHAKLAR